MSNSACSIDTFRQLSFKLNISIPDYWFEQNPSWMVSRLLERIKFGAKILARTAKMQQTTALAHIAVAVGFPHWHALNAHLVGIATTPPQNTVDSESISRLAQCLVFLIRTSSETSVSSEQLSAFEIFGAKLAKSTGLPLEVVMDTVCSGYCGEDSWVKVKERSPLNSTVALYRFEVEGSMVGQFIWSDACSELVRTLDEVYQDAGTPKAMLKAKAWIEEAVKRQPDFFEAWLCLAQINYDMGDLSTADLIINENIKKAERLIPKDFRGKIAWVCLGNRFYHRMLALRMTINHDAGRIRDYLRDARKQLRLNPNDNLGVRYIYPLMLLEVGEYEKAAKAARLSNEDRCHASLIRSFARFAIGDYSGFIKNFTVALFDIPVLRLMLLDSPDGLPDGDDGYRTVIPDMGIMEEYIIPTYYSVPGLVEACSRLLSSQSVIEAETQLRTYWLAWRARLKVQSYSIKERIADADGWQILRANLSTSIQLLVAEELSDLGR